MLTVEFQAAIRSDSLFQSEYIDVSTLSYTKEAVMIKIVKAGKDINKTFPAKRISTVKLSEVDSGQ